MFVILLRFSANRGEAGKFTAGHQQWIKRGFDDGVFLLVGSLKPNAGGGILAHNISLADLQNRVNDDPFVAEDIVTSESGWATGFSAEMKIHSTSMLGRHALWQRSWARMAKHAAAGVAPHRSFLAITTPNGVFPSPMIIACWRNSVWRVFNPD